MFGIICHLQNYTTENSTKELILRIKYPLCFSRAIFYHAFFIQGMHRERSMSVWQTERWPYFDPTQVS